MILRNDLKVGSIYDIRCRNLLSGVWSGHRFIGIRMKFGNRYLDAEVLADDQDGRGTVTEVLQYLGEIPSDIDPVEGWSLGGKWKSNLRLYQILEEYPHG